jgi:hypothetical protein
MSVVGFWIILDKITDEGVSSGFSACNGFDTLSAINLHSSIWLFDIVVPSMGFIGS